MADAPHPPSAWQIERTMSAWQRVQAMLEADTELDLDEGAIWRELDQAERIKHPDELLSRLIDAARWCALRETEADELRREMAARRDRYSARIEQLRSTIFDLLETLGKTSHRGRIGKALFVAGRGHVVITDPAALTDEYVRVTIEPNKELIAEHIKAGVIVPGAEMSNPAPTLQIRKA